MRRLPKLKLVFWLGVFSQTISHFFIIIALDLTKIMQRPIQKVLVLFIGFFPLIQLFKLGHIELGGRVRAFLFLSVLFVLLAFFFVSPSFLKVLGIIRTLKA